MATDQIDRVVPIVDPNTGRATERMESFARSVLDPRGATRITYQNLSGQSAVCDNSTPGVLVGESPRLAANALAVGGTLQLVCDGHVGSAGSSNKAEFSLYLNDGTSSVALATQMEVFGTAGTVDIDAFRIVCDVTRISQTQLQGCVRIETTATNTAAGAAPYVGVWFVQSLTGPDFSVPINIEFYGRVTNASSRTFYLDNLRVARTKAL